MVLRKIKLTEKKQRWVGKREIALKGKPLSYNVSAQMRYQKAVIMLLKPMLEKTKRKVIALFNKKSAKKYFKQQTQIASTRSASDALEINQDITVLSERLINELQKEFQQEFNQQAPELANYMYEEMLKSSEVALKSSLNTLSGGLSLATEVIPKGLNTVSKALIDENIKLIKTIPADYFKQIQGAVMRSITTDAGLDYLIPEIDKYATQNLRHTRWMALDQTRKAYNNINKQKMLSLGVKKYEWRHTGGSQTPREDHIAMNGNIYSFDKPPIIDRRTGARGIPGDAINCRCIMISVLEFED